MPREPVEYKRKSGLKSPAIFYLAVEGQKTEVHYFDELNRKLRDSRFKVSVVPRADGTYSAPKHVLAGMQEHIKALKTRGADDQFWIVIDRDSWPVDQLNEVASGAQTDGINIAFSNPCFEIWLLFHYHAVKNMDELNALNAKRKVKEKLVAALRSSLGSYSPNSPPFEKLYPLLQTAIENAKAVTPDQKWFEDIGSTVHILMTALHDELGVSAEIIEAVVSMEVKQ